MLSLLLLFPAAHATPITFQILQGVVTDDRVTVTYRLTESSWTNVQTVSARAARAPALLWRIGDERVRTPLDSPTAVVTLPIPTEPVPATSVRILAGDLPFDTLRYLNREDIELPVPYGPPIEIVVDPGPPAAPPPEVTALIEGVDRLAAAQRARRDARDALDPTDPTVQACERLARNYGRVKCVRFAEARAQGPLEVQTCARMPSGEKGACYDWLQTKPTPAGAALQACLDAFGPTAALGCAKRMDDEVRPRGDQLLDVCVTDFASKRLRRVCAKTLTDVPDADHRARCATENKPTKQLACLKR